MKRRLEFKDVEVRQGKCFYSQIKFNESGHIVKDTHCPQIVIAHRLGSDMFIAEDWIGNMLLWCYSEIS